jgi:hypothetical protein
VNNGAVETVFSWAPAVGSVVGGASHGAFGNRDFDFSNLFVYFLVN